MRSKWIIWAAIALHVLWGGLLLCDESAGWVTAIHLFVHLCGSSTAAGIIYLCVSVMAACSLLRGRSSVEYLELIGLLPQQVILMISALGAVAAISRGMFADGVVRPRAFISADQGNDIIFCLFHTAAMIDVHLVAIWKALRNRRP